MPAVLKDSFYNVGQLQLCKDSLALRAHSLYVFLFKEFATEDSNASCERCRVVLVICRLSDHKYRHVNVYVA